MTKKRSGFTLVELLIVLGVLGVLVMVTAGISYNARHRWTLSDFARNITTSYHQLRQLATRENIPCRMKFSAKGFELFRGQRDGAGTLSWPTDPIRTYSIGPTSTVFIRNPGLDLAIDSRGYVYQTNDACSQPFAMAGIQTLEVQAPHHRGETFGDRILITVFPFGGLNVQKTLSITLP